MVRVLRAFKIRQMTRHTGIGRIGEITAKMAFCTIRNFVPFGQGKKIVIDLIGMPAGGMEVVAF